MNESKIQERAHEFMERHFGQQWFDDMKNVNLYAALLCQFNDIAIEVREACAKIDDVGESLEGWPVSAGFAPLSNGTRATLADYEKAMEEAIPAMIADSQERAKLAHEARQRGHLSQRIDELLAEMPQGKTCPKCGGMMVHERLTGYHCFRRCQQ